MAAAWVAACSRSDRWRDWILIWHVEWATVDYRLIRGSATVCRRRASLGD